MSKYKSGMVRHFDELGRIVPPIEMRREVGLDGDRDRVEFFVHDDCICIWRAPAKDMQCSCCSADETTAIIVRRGNTTLCPKCIKAFENDSSIKTAEVRRSELRAVETA